MKPTLALVQGDAAGIGPELMTKLLSIDEVRRRANILIVSDRRVFDTGCEVTGLRPKVTVVAEASAVQFTTDTPVLLDVPALDPAEIEPGKVWASAGAAALQWLGRALDLTKEGMVDGICFMPFSKEAMGKAGMQQEDEAQWSRAKLGYQGRVSEFNVVDGMWNGRVTSHVPLREVASLLSIDRIVEAVRLAHDTLKAAGIARPRIVVAGLNPHAGDGGKLGSEEIEIIRPAVEAARKRQIAVDGPLPADTLYLKVRDGDYDCAMTMYHDQGQIAIKLLGFDRGVSVLAGLPVPMATAAHGTAFDIVGRNLANVEPTRRAFMMAADMAESHIRSRKGEMAQQ